MRRFYAIRCFEPPLGEHCYYTTSGFRTAIEHFDSRKQRDEWASRPSVWPEKFRQAVNSKFVVHCPAEHANFYVREVA